MHGENTHIHQTEHICNRSISPRDWLYKNYKNEDSAIKHCSSDLYINSNSLPSVEPSGKLKLNRYITERLASSQSYCPLRSQSKAGSEPFVK